MSHLSPAATAPSWHARTRVAFGLAGLDDWAGERALRRALLLIDAALVGSELLAELTERLTRLGVATDEVVLRGAGDLTSVGDLSRTVETVDAQTVVAVGGGSVLDQAKVATMVAEQPSTMAAMRVPQRSGGVDLQRYPGRLRPLVAVPTTLGTGSEVSSVACLQYPSGKRLLLSEGLAPELAVLDPLATRTLPEHLLAEGILEVFFRLSSGFVGGSDDGLPIQDALSLALVEQVVLLGYQAARRDRSAPDAVRLDVARISAMSHMPWLTVGRNRFAAKGWYVANELSTVLSIRKMTAIAAVLPAVWERVMAGDPLWGTETKLGLLWQKVHAAYPRPLPVEPVSGIQALMDDWRIGRALAIDDAVMTATVSNVIRSWGGGLPMLAGVKSEHVRDLLGRSVLIPRKITSV